MDVLTYLQNYEPNELVSIGNGTYTTKTHDSMRISNGLWNWFSRGIGGKSAVDYLMKVEGYTFKEAVEIIIDKTKVQRPFIYENNEQTKKENKLILPEKATASNRAKSYLMSRGIAKEIVEECIKNNLIYEEKNYHNVVFVGYDKNKNARYAFCRATNDTRFMRDAKGSDKDYTFRLDSLSNSKRVHLFESSIDLLSYATLMKIKNLDFHNENMLSLAGVFKPSKEEKNIKIPGTIKKYLEENPNIKEIHLHLDNDEVGRAATENLKTLLSEKYKVFDSPAPMGKDCNDYLCYVLGLKNFIKQTKENQLKNNRLAVR
jgi:hypothetical protein